MRRIPQHIAFIFAVYLAGILFFTAFRLLLLLTNLQQAADLPDKTALLWQAFWMGFRFDTVVSGYVLALPLVGLTIASFFNSTRNWIYRSAAYFLSAAYAALFLASAADIPYFRYFFSRLTVASLNWTDAPTFMVRMILSEFRYLIYLLVFVAAVWLFGRLTIRLSRAILEMPAKGRGRTPLLMNVFVSLLAGAALFVGIRGRLAQKSPIRAGTAYFSNYAFPNQLGLNPAFTFIRSWLDARKPENRALHLINDDVAIDKVRAYLNVEADTTLASPIARRVDFAEQPMRANIVLVMMESMAAAKMGRYGDPDSLTPVLDSLANIGYCFDHIYTDGIHTYNGIYATLFSYPTLLRRHPMKATIIPPMSGFAKMLSEQGYNTIFFTTHDEQFDNMAGFLRANGFHDVISQKDYPRDKILSTLGVPDDYLFEFAIKRFDELHERGRPFFAAMLTASDHGPYIIPPWAEFQPRSGDARKQIVEYADWSVGRLLAMARQQEWYDSTLFVFVADHGAIWGRSDYDVPLSYFHTPLIVFGPTLLGEARVFGGLGGQIDIFPTVMGLLRMDYVNNTFGVDLRREERPCIFFTSDDKIGCLNREFFLVHREDGLESLYRYRAAESDNYLDQYPATADSLRTYAFSMLQGAQWMIENKKTD
jgi:phosphoglycerol transferase MdoB-like AlkP superfamily enzyme